MSLLPAHFSDSNRPRRMAELLLTLWILAIADLIFTLWAHSFTPFYEVNPVAGLMLKHNLIPSLILFKLVVTTIGTHTFWRVRTHARAEFALWAMVGVYVLLAFRWSNYTLAALAMV